MMYVYRIADRKHTSLEGLGGVFAPGRWHEKGHRVIYASGSRALAAWEKFIHISSSDLIPDNLVIMVIEIPDENFITVPDSVLVPGWNKFPHKPETIRYGTDFLENCNPLALKVPSALINKEFNYILNPNYPNFATFCKVIDIEKFMFDQRISNIMD